jgi:large subunit ribosomal protein L15
VILNDVLGAGPRREKKIRVGRGPGSGLGKTAGRGQHGAYSRSGNSSKLGFQGGTMRFFRRLPRRGFNNANFRVDWPNTDVGQLDKNFAAGETVTLALAIERGLVHKNAERLKILGDGEIAKAVTLAPEIAVSASARAKIEKAGGKVGAPLPAKEPPNWKRIAVEKERAAKVEKAEKEKTAKAEKGAEKPPKAEKAGGEGGDKPARAEKTDKGERPPKAERPEGAPKGEKPAKEPGAKKSGGEKPPKNK